MGDMMSIKKGFIKVVVLSSVLASGASFADPGHGEGHGQGHEGHGNPHDMAQYNKEAAKYHKEEAKFHEKEMKHYEKAYKHDKGWKRGGYLPSQYRGRGYYVHNWKAANLRAPSPDQRWVRVNNDYLLVNIANNLILDVLVGR